MSAGGETFDAGSTASIEPARAAPGRGWDAAVALVALLGLADAIYLTVHHFTNRNVRCMVVSGCDEVLQSTYSTVAGSFPLAALGALAYFAVFSLATLAAFGYGGVRALLSVTVGVMFLFTLWLLYLQGFVIKAFCTYCLISAAVTTTLALLLVARRLKHPSPRR
ncbi:MAG TPA: vitamin K epoxide reductase family protein [Pyrinomonadaceae bacterium]|nr:vitamin K epoxide reductase family protein [Pyrinomonadaceae bacterium]